MQLDIKYSPDGNTLDYSPFTLYRLFPGQYDDTTCLDCYSSGVYQWTVLIARATSYTV